MFRPLRRSWCVNVAAHGSLVRASTIGRVDDFRDGVVEGRAAFFDGCLFFGGCLPMVGVGSGAVESVATRLVVAVIDHGA